VAKAKKKRVASRKPAAGKRAAKRKPSAKKRAVPRKAAAKSRATGASARPRDDAWRKLVERAVLQNEPAGPGKGK
jgi:hypothetical protein